MRKATLGLALTIGTAAGVVADSSPTFAQGEPIKFGSVVSATGVGAGLGVNERNGLLLAEKTINAKGGFKGRPIRIIIEDDTSNPDTAVTKVTSDISKLTVKKGGKTRGYYESVACKGKTRPIEVTFLSEAGESKTASRTSTEDISSGRRGGLRSHQGAQGPTYDQLYEEAKRRDIHGRSDMNKEELRRALGDKCGRCWNYSQAVGSDAEPPELCERCLPVVRELPPVQESA